MRLINRYNQKPRVKLIIIVFTYFLCHIVCLPGLSRESKGEAMTQNQRTVTVSGDGRSTVVW